MVGEGGNDAQVGVDGALFQAGREIQDVGLWFEFVDFQLVGVLGQRLLLTRRGAQGVQYRDETIAVRFVIGLELQGQG